MANKGTFNFEINELLKSICFVGVFLCLLTLITGCKIDNVNQPTINASIGDGNNSLPFANCEQWAIFPKGNSINTAESDEVIVWKCIVDNESCYYIAPLGYLGASLDCK
jgi:hypothetical protein